MVSRHDRGESCVSVRDFLTIGAAAITACRYAYSSFGWNVAVGLGTAVLLLPLGIGLMEITQERMVG
jgi:hypothetical protein